jgi:hypothetical protein
MTPKRSIDPAIVRNIHERAVKAALADLYTELMTADDLRYDIEEALAMGLPADVAQRAAGVSIDERLHPGTKVLAYRPGGGR